ncbi:hypothetical protein T11_10116 [Trichinella zimbabwensis]|uniref:Uncharacterized protein n=1 Tax=Trichinella zimbabwensis TaxID=268475 RepID=A0A0V1HAK4_9BILA|nr:hypothetical protein T11_10116 [Trichinella zimbabwensis]
MNRYSTTLLLDNAITSLTKLFISKLIEFYSLKLPNQLDELYLKSESHLVKCTWNLGRIFVHLSKVENYAEFELNFVVPALLGDLQFGLSLSDLCCFRENMTKLSLDLRQLPCE